MVERVTRETAQKLLERTEGGIVETVVSSLYKGKKTPSEKFRKKVVQNYEPEKITMVKAGQTINIYDKTQEFLRETEFYSVLEDYNCTKDEALQRMNNNLQEIKADLDLTSMGTYSDHLRAVNQAKEMFDNLPLKVRQKFDNNVEVFLKEGGKYIDGLIEEQNIKNGLNTPIETPVEAVTENYYGEETNG